MSAEYTSTTQDITPLVPHSALSTIEEEFFSPESELSHHGNTEYDSEALDGSAGRM